jgi:CRP-like cAMP-binding protein
MSKVDDMITAMQRRNRSGVTPKTDKPARTRKAGNNTSFNAQAFLDSVQIPKTVIQYGRGDTIFTQGDACEHVLYIQSGGVKLSVLSKTGKEAVVGDARPGRFLRRGVPRGSTAPHGERHGDHPSAILRVGKRQMVELLHQQHAMSDRFIVHMLTRNIRIEEDLIDQLFNSSEKRLARTLCCWRATGSKPSRSAWSRRSLRRRSQR